MLQLSGEFIACIAAIYFFTTLSTGFRWLAIHAITAFLVELAGFIMRTHGHTDNQWLFNCYLPGDCALQLLAAYYLATKIPRYLFIVGFLAFLITWAMEIYTKGVMVFTVKAYIIDSILQMLAYLFVQHKAAMDYRGRFARCPELWVCLGIITYYGCNIPFFSILGYLVVIKAYDVIKLLFVILEVLIHIRYLFVAVAFCLYCKIHHPLKPSTDALR